MKPRKRNSRLPRVLLPCLGCLAVLAYAPAVPAAESGPPAEAQRRAATMADIGRLRLELGTAADDSAALEALKEAARLDPANIRARFWLGIAWLRVAGLGTGRPLDVESAARAGLELEAVFRLAALERSGESEDLRLRAVNLLDLCAAGLPASEKRFGPWWRKRRAELLEGQKLVTLTHTVVRGDTLPALARRYYGSAGLAARIAEANPGVDFRRLPVGTRLNVPNVRLEPPAPVPAVDAIDRELLGQLASSIASAKRRVAAERLAARETLMAVPALVGALRADDSPAVRTECARSLGVIASPDAEPALCAALRADAWPGCRLESARALARLGGRGSLSALLDGLDDENPQVAAASARSLGAMGLEGAAGRLLATLGSRSEPLRRAAAWALAGLARREALGADERRRLEALARKGPAEARAAASLALARIDPAAAAPLLTGGLDGDDGPVRRASAEGLALAAASVKLEPKTVEALAGLASADGDPAVTLGAAEALARSGKGTVAGKAGLLALAGLLDEQRAVYWYFGDEPEPASAVAARLLGELTGARLPAERARWTAWIEKESQ